MLSSYTTRHLALTYATLFLMSLHCSFCVGHYCSLRRQSDIPWPPCLEWSCVTHRPDVFRRRDQDMTSGQSPDVHTMACRTLVIATCPELLGKRSRLPCPVRSSSWPCRNSLKCTDPIFRIWQPDFERDYYCTTLYRRASRVYAMLVSPIISSWRRTPHVSKTEVLQGRM